MPSPRRELEDRGRYSLVQSVCMGFAAGEWNLDRAVYLSRDVVEHCPRVTDGAADAEDPDGNRIGKLVGHQIGRLTTFNHHSHLESALQPG